MRKMVRRVFACLLLTALVWCWALLKDRQKLNEELIRLHVVANSDSPEDQALKLQVRDAIVKSLQEDLSGIGSVEQALSYLQENMPKLRSIANGVLETAGVEPDAVVSLCREAFDTRYYDTFALPAGVYNALRITIGEGQGKNWWCVVFPTLCRSATAADFEDAAVEAGFTRNLSDTLAADGEYQIRFFLLDQLGRLENKRFGE